MVNRKTALGLLLTAFAAINMPVWAAPDTGAGTGPMADPGTAYSAQTAGADPLDQTPLQFRNVHAARVRGSSRIAYQLARYEWLDRVAAADPHIIAAICAHHGPARIVAGHRHLERIAEYDHYLCRRLTRWPDVTNILIHNPGAERVISLDPQGIYVAIERNPGVARVLASHTMFSDMTINNPQLAEVIMAHMR